MATFNLNLKIYKGEIVAVMPHKGYAFIKPLWAEEGDKPIFCHYGNDREKARSTCFIKILGGGKKFPYSVEKNLWGEEVYVPKKPQEVYFKLAVQKTANKEALMCYDLCDRKHISAEEAEKASKGSEKEPNWKEFRLPVVTENGEELDCKIQKAEKPAEEPVVEPTVETPAEKPAEAETPTAPAKEEKKNQDNYMSIYTDEELEEFDAEDEEEDMYDEDIDSYDEYDNELSYDKIYRSRKEQQ